MTNCEIAHLLWDYRRLKKDLRNLREEMLKQAVEVLGINRKAAQKTNLEAFLDGYLAGQEMPKASLETTSYDISALLCHCLQLKKNARKLHTEMLRVAVEEIGMDQDFALQANIEVFLDGYLVGQGMMQSWRKPESTNPTVSRTKSIGSAIPN